MSRLCYTCVHAFCECHRLSRSGFLVRSVRLALWLCLPRQYRSTCPLARDDKIPPFLAPVQDTEILGVEPEELVLCEEAMLSLCHSDLQGMRPFAGS